MKTNLTKYALIGLTLLMLGCSRSSEDYADENYEKLFPFHGIEKPKVSYEDQIVQLGDPDAPISDYVYPGVDITENVRKYKVTLICSFNEVERANHHIYSQIGLSDVSLCQRSGTARFVYKSHYLCHIRRRVHHCEAAECKRTSE